MSTLVFVNLEISTQADGAQSPRVPVPFPEDPYEAIRQAYLVKTETPESPHTVASPTPLPNNTPPMLHAEDSVDSDTFGARSTPLDSTAPLSPDHPFTHASPTLVPIICRTACMAVRVLPAMSPGLSASIAEVAAMSDSAFCKRFRSSYESSPPDLPSRKRYRGTSKLVEDDEQEEDDEEEDEEEDDEEVEECSDSDSESEDAEDESPTTEHEDPVAGDEGLAEGDEGPDIRVESLSLGGDAAVPKGQQQAALVVEIAVGEPLGFAYRALRRRERASREGQMPNVFEPTLTTWIDPYDGRTYIYVPAYPPPAPPVQTPPSLEWSPGSLSVSPVPSIVPSPISSPMIPLTVPSPVASPRYDRDIGELFTRSRAVKDEIFYQRHQFRSLEHEQERVVVTFGAIWRPVLVLESWEGQTDAQRITEERRAQLDLAEIVDSMRRGQEPRGDV
ncbi:hypothetical protein Tco_0869942 [Tanacetum coccineum]